MRRSHAVLTIIAAGIIARFALLLLVDPFAHTFAGDAGVYMAGRHPSAYSLFLTIPWQMALLLQCAFTIGSGVGAYLVLRSFWTGLLIAICPFFAFYDFILMSESLYVNLTFWAFLLYRTRSWAGLFMGLAILVRGTLLFLPAAVLLACRTRKSALFAALAYVVALPILPALGREHGGMTLWIGTWERTPEWYLKGLQHPVYPARAHVTPAEADALQRDDDPAMRRNAITRMVGNPAEVALNWAIRYPRLWIGTRSDQITWRIKGPVWVVLKCLFLGLNVTLLLLGFLGLWRERDLFAVPVLYTALVYLPFHNAETRYSLVALPFLLFYAVRFGGALMPRIPWLNRFRLGAETSEPPNSIAAP